MTTSDNTMSAESKLFKLNPIIYLKLLADHYLFSFDSASLLIKKNVCWIKIRTEKKFRKEEKLLMWKGDQKK